MKFSILAKPLLDNSGRFIANVDAENSDKYIGTQAYGDTEHEAMQKLTERLEKKGYTVLNPTY